MQHIRTWRAPRAQDAAPPAAVNEGLEQGLLLRADSADACSTDVDGASPSSSVQGGSSSSLVWLGSNQQIAALYGDGEAESKTAQAKKALTAQAAAQSAQQEAASTWFARPARMRPPGAPAGAWPHTPWFVTVFYDPYERVNVWSHGLPGIALLLIGILAWLHVLPGGKPLLVFGCCAATTHLLSAVTHIWPDDHFLEKIDHFGIVVLIAGTPLSALMAIRPEGPFDMMLAVAGGLLVAAMLPPVPRVIGFVVLGTLVPWRYSFLFDWNLTAQVLLNLGGAVAFLRNGGHNRPAGLQDHHILHYLVTVACGLHVAYIMHATSQHAAAALPQQPQQLLQL